MVEAKTEKTEGARRKLGTKFFGVGLRERRVVHRRVEEKDITRRLTTTPLRGWGPFTDSTPGSLDGLVGKRTG